MNINSSSNSNIINKNHFSAQDLQHQQQNLLPAQHDQMLLISQFSQSTTSLNINTSHNNISVINQNGIRTSNTQNQNNLWSTQKYQMPQNLILEMNECLQQLDNLEDNDDSMIISQQPFGRSNTLELENINRGSNQKLTLQYQQQHQQQQCYQQNNHHSDQLNYERQKQSKQIALQLQAAQMHRSSSNNLKNSKHNNDIYSFERLNQDDVSLSCNSNFQMAHGTTIVGGLDCAANPHEHIINNNNNSMNLSHLQQSTPQLFRQELKNMESAQSTPQINIQELSQQIKAALIAGSSPTSERKKNKHQNNDHLQGKMFETQDASNKKFNGTGGAAPLNKDSLPSQFSTNYKSKNPYKSRQISIHTNAFLATDAGDNFSNNQEIFSTARTTSQMGGSSQNINSHKRVTSTNTKSFFNQTNNNTFISYDNNTVDQQQQQMLLLKDSTNQNPSSMVPTVKTSHNNLNIINSDSNFNIFQSQCQPDPLLMSQIQSQIFQTLNSNSNNSNENIIDRLETQNTLFTNTTTNTPHNASQSQLQQSKQRKNTNKKDDCSNNINDCKNTINTNNNHNHRSDSSYGEEFVEKYQQALKVYQDELAQQTYAQKKRLVTYDEEIKLRPTLKRKIKPLIQEPSDVPMNVYYKIISFDGRMFKKFVCLSKGMRKHLLFYIFDSTFQIAKDFNKKYGQLLTVESRYLSLTPLSFNKEEGTRLELTLRVWVKPEAAKKIQDKSVILSNGYSLEKPYDQTLTESRINGEYQSVYQFDLFKKESKRWMWIHKDECLFHGSTDARAYSMPIMPICVDDQFEISITLLNLMGALDFNSVKWQSLRVEPLPNQDDVRDYNRFKNLTPTRDLFQKYFADLKRVCEVEDTVLEWFNEPYVRTKSLRSHIKRTFDANQFKDQFEVINVEVGGIDFSVWKVQLRGLKEPKVEYKYYNELNIGIKNIGSGSNSHNYISKCCSCPTSIIGCDKNCSKNDQNQQKQLKKSVCNEVKRTGFLIDRGADIEVRGGDTLIVYLSMGGFEK